MYTHDMDTIHKHYVRTLYTDTMHVHTLHTTQRIHYTQTYHAHTHTVQHAQHTHTHTHAGGHGHILWKILLLPSNAIIETLIHLDKTDKIQT